MLIIIFYEKFLLIFNSGRTYKVIKIAVSQLQFSFGVGKGRAQYIYGLRHTVNECVKITRICQP